MIVVQGSSRSDGNTRKVADLLISKTGAEFMDLWAHSIKEFSYKGPGNDDFEKLMSEIVEHDVLIMITPIYWYSMSARMKIFFDRITDLLKWNKELGRKLRSKKLLVVSSSMHDDAPKHFSHPFEMSAGYLGMEYMGYCHTWIEDDAVSEASRLRIDELIAIVQ